MIFDALGRQPCFFLYSLVFFFTRLFFSLLACFFSLLATSKEKKHWPVPGRRDSLLTRDGKLTIKFARPLPHIGTHGTSLLHAHAKLQVNHSNILDNTNSINAERLGERPWGTL